jgi:hypothetical protein
LIVGFVRHRLNPGIQDGLQAFRDLSPETMRQLRQFRGLLLVSRILRHGCQQRGEVLPPAGFHVSLGIKLIRQRHWQAIVVV